MQVSKHGCDAHGARLHESRITNYVVNALLRHATPRHALPENPRMAAHVTTRPHDDSTKRLREKQSQLRATRAVIQSLVLRDSI